MFGKVRQKIIEYAKLHRQYRRWRCFVTAMAAVVVFCTTYALILPAITLERDTAAQWNGWLEPESDLASDSNAETAATPSNAWFPIRDDVVSEADPDDSDGELIDDLWKIPGHVHTDICFGDRPVLVCGMEEDDGHIHTEACFQMAQVLICNEPKPHRHDDSCYDEDGRLACIYSNREEHVHTEGCLRMGYMLTGGAAEEEDGGGAFTATPSNAQSGGEKEHLATASNAEAGDGEETVKYSTATASNAEAADTVRQYRRRLATPANAWLEDDDCYEPVLVLACGFYDPLKNILNTDWKATLPDPLSGEWVKDFLAVAESQLGYTESTDDYIETESGDIRGYTWYGDWYGDPYGSWNSMFVSFCLNYAGIPEDAVPREKEPQSWQKLLSSEEWELYEDAADYTPNPGDLLFLDMDKDGKTDRTGIVTDYTEGAGITAIEGDVKGTPAENAGADSVDYMSYDLTDDSIVGYVLLSSLDEISAEPTDAFMLSLHQRTGRKEDYKKIADYSSWQWNDLGTGRDLTDVLHIQGTDNYLIPVSYFTENYAKYGYSFDESHPGNCPFLYAPNANDSLKELTAATYVQEDGRWYVQIEDTTGLTPHRSNIYYGFYKTVDDTVNHPSSVINLFNYWVTNDPEDPDNDDSFNDEGINEGHKLKFSNGYFGKGVMNGWTGNSSVYPGIVANTLADGYPVLSSDKTSSGESLAYLFDPARSHAGKSAYRNVTGLLQIDDSGYYYYDSAINFAEYDKEDNKFTLYEDWGVKAGGKSPDGQFFPFNSMQEAADLKSTDAPINHYLGVTLTTRFVQQYGGHTSSSRTADTVFEFAGDDDVWIFIDDVLVADLGGIHDAASVEINFSTGEIAINGSQSTNLYDAFVSAGKENMVSWDIDTGKSIFADGTYHTLKFYYLERGNTDSNLF